MEDSQTALEKMAEDGDCSAMIALAHSCRDRGDLVQFENWMIKAFGAGDEGGVEDAVMELVEYYEQNGLAEKADAFYDMVGKTSSYQIIGFLGEELKGLGLLDKAIKWLENAFHLCSDQQKFWYAELLSDAHAELGRDEEATRWR